MNSQQTDQPSDMIDKLVDEIELKCPLEMSIQTFRGLVEANLRKRRLELCENAPGKVVDLDEPSRAPAAVGKRNLKRKTIEAIVSSPDLRSATSVSSVPEAVQNVVLLPDGTTVRGTEESLRSRKLWPLTNGRSYYVMELYTFVDRREPLAFFPVTRWTLLVTDVDDRPRCPFDAEPQNCWEGKCSGCSRNKPARDLVRKWTYNPYNLNKSDYIKGPAVLQAVLQDQVCLGGRPRCYPFGCPISTYEEDLHQLMRLEKNKLPAVDMPGFSLPLLYCEALAADQSRCPVHSALCRTTSQRHPSNH